MGSFWTSSEGEITGEPEKAFISDMSLIPNGSKLIALILDFKTKEYMGKEYYQITWQIKDYKFNNKLVFQKIHAFDEDENKAFRAKNMLKRLYQMFNVKPKHSDAPKDQDLAVFVGKEAGLKIQEWHKDDKSGNFVSEVHLAKGFESELGTYKDVKPETEPSQPTPTLDLKSDELNDDIPF